MFEGLDVVVLEGPEGRGKTVTAALFARRHLPRVFTTFLRSGSRWAYDPVTVCTDLSQQVALALGRTLNSDDPVTLQTYEQLIFYMRRWLRSKDASVYFVVDGLYEIPYSDSTYAK